MKIEGGNIEIHGPGAMEFKASVKELTGPVDGAGELPHMPEAKPAYHEAFRVIDKETGEPVSYTPYRIENAKGEVIASGITDEAGNTVRSFTKGIEELKIFLGDEA